MGGPAAGCGLPGAARHRQQARPSVRAHLGAAARLQEALHLLGNDLARRIGCGILHAGAREVGRQRLGQQAAGSAPGSGGGGGWRRRALKLACSFLMMACVAALKPASMSAGLARPGRREVSEAVCWRGVRLRGGLGALPTQPAIDCDTAEWRNWLWRSHPGPLATSLMPTRAIALTAACASSRPLIELTCHTALPDSR